MSTVIVTVGTSLLTNQDAPGVAVPRPWPAWRHASSHAAATPALPDVSAAALAQYFARADKKIVSAETNTLLSMPLEEGDRLVWLHSETPEGEWCARRLHEHYMARGHHSELKPIAKLAYAHADFAEAGLKSFADVVLGVIKVCGAENAKLCATGGFKAEIAFANLIGFLLGVPVYYIHERFREIVELPRVPLSVDVQVVERHRDFFEWIDAEPRAASEVAGRLHGRDEVRPFLLFDGEHTMLSALGDLLLDAWKRRSAPPARWPAPSPLLPDQKIRLQNTAHHRPKGYRAFVDWLAGFGCVSSISYDGAATGGAPTTRFNGTVAGALDASFTFSDGQDNLGLRVGTTARDAHELQTFTDYAAREIRLRW
jgi:putative CRISPR-associated protein (TIGR02619 family)